MKAKVQLTDTYTGRSINIITTLVADDFTRDYGFSWATLTKYQRKKIEDYFGGRNAYYTKIEIIKVYKDK